MEKKPSWIQLHVHGLLVLDEKQKMPSKSKPGILVKEKECPTSKIILKTLHVFNTRGFDEQVDSSSTQDGSGEESHMPR